MRSGKLVTEPSKQAGAPTFRYRKPVDRRSRLQRWRDVVAELQDLQDEYQAWLEALPPNMADSAHRRGPCAQSATSTWQNWRALFRHGGLAATKLLHDVKCDQIATSLTRGEGTLIIINKRIG
jgi:hypothetical protein